MNSVSTRSRLATAVLVIALSLVALPSVSWAAGGESSAGVVNVNQATAGELALLPRVGPALAQRILDFRKENGPFKTKSDLMLVRGIGEKTFELLSPYVILEGSTTLKSKVRASQAQPKSLIQPESHH